MRALTAPWTKLAGGIVLFSAAGAALAIAFGRLPIGGKAFPAGGALGAGVAGLLTEQLNRSGALVLVLTALFLSLLMVTSCRSGASPRSPAAGRVAPPPNASPPSAPGARSAGATSSART